MWSTCFYNWFWARFCAFLKSVKEANTCSDGECSVFFKQDIMPVVVISQLTIQQECKTVSVK